MLSRVVVSLLLGMGITTIGALAVMIQKFGFSFSLSDMTGSHSASERLYAAKQALELISETPFLGKGIGYVYSMDVGPHNMILRALVEGGGVGLLALVGLVVAFFWVAYVRKSYGLFVLGLALTTIAMTTHNLTEDRSVIVIVGMLLAASHNSRVNLKKPVLARVGFVTS